MLKPTDVQPEKREAIVIKKYANRRLYNTETSTYVTLEDLAAMVRSDKDFVVYDAKTGDDLTHAVLTQIIVEQESREGGQTMLPIPFLRQLIRFYDDQLGRMVPGYLQFSLETLTKEQEKFRNQFASAFGNPAAAFEVYQEQVRRNMQIFEQAMSMWSPFGQPLKRSTPPQPMSAPSAHQQPAPGSAPVSPVAPAAPRDELAELRNQLSAMQQKIEKLSQKG